MTTIEQLVKTEELKPPRTHYRSVLLHYNGASDTLLISPITETVVHYLDEHIALLYEPESLEIVGFQIEAFRHSFLSQR